MSAADRAAAAAGILIDRWLGEPPLRTHPVAAFGQAMQRVERRARRNRRLAGAGYAALGVGGAALTGGLAGGAMAAGKMAGKAVLFRGLAGGARRLASGGGAAGGGTAAGGTGGDAVAGHHGGSHTGGSHTGASHTGASHTRASHTRGGHTASGHTAGRGEAGDGSSGLGASATTLASWVVVAGRGLGEAALKVAAALEAGDLDEARRLLPSLVGRDVGALREEEIVRAVVESVAANTVDAVVAPALWAAVGGPAGAFGYRAANTLDSMVARRSPRDEQFGWASGRLDDMANWVPARLTAMLVATVRPRRSAAVLRAVRRDAPGHPSPNAGVAEAAFAAALGVRLGGVNSYDGRIEVHPSLGSGRPPEVTDIARAVKLANAVGLSLAGLLAGQVVLRARDLPALLHGGLPALRKAGAANLVRGGVPKLVRAGATALPGHRRAG